MLKKPVIVIIEDNESWLKKIFKIINKYFDVEIEQFSSFSVAEDRLMETPCNYDLLVVDIYPSESSKDTLGLKFANFVNSINKVPVIVVTGQKSLVKPLLQDYNFLDVIYKGEFDRIDFIYSLNKVKIIESNKRITPNDSKGREGDPDKQKPDFIA